MNEALIRLNDWLPKTSARYVSAAACLAFAARGRA